jgi:hypothetical protein
MAKVEMVSNDPAVPSASAVMKTELEADAIGLLGATMQAITHIARRSPGSSSRVHRLDGGITPRSPTSSAS